MESTSQWTATGVISALVGCLVWFVKDWMPARTERNDSRFDALVKENQGRLDSLILASQARFDALVKENQDRFDSLSLRYEKRVDDILETQAKERTSERREHQRSLDALCTRMEAMTARLDEIGMSMRSTGDTLADLERLVLQMAPPPGGKAAS